MEQFFEQVETQNDSFVDAASYVGEVIKVIGVGGGGCNAIDNMILGGVKDVEFIAANTDYKSLVRSKAHHLIQLGKSTTKGLGAGTLPEVGKKAAIEDEAQIMSLLKGTDMLFLTAGMGGGTGTGASPVIADIAKKMNILTVGVVTRPFDYEGITRRKVAEEGIEQLSKHVDSLIVIPNEKLMTELDADVSMRDAFAAADDVLRNAVSGITEVIKTPGLISLDYADVKTVMSGRGIAMMGSGTAKGQNRAREAVEKAIYSPLLDNISLEGARGVLVNVSTATGSLKLSEYNEIIRIVSEHIDQNAVFKPGMAEIDGMDPEELRVTVIATGLIEVSDSAPHYFSEKESNAHNIVQHHDDAMDIGEQNVKANSDDAFASFNNGSGSSIPAFFRKRK